MDTSSNSIEILNRLQDLAAEAGQSLDASPNADAPDAPDAVPGDALFWATCVARTLGTSGTFEADLDCSNGVKLRFEGKHSAIGVVGAFGGTGPGILVVDPAGLVGKEVDYALAATPTLGIVAFNATWINTGNMTGGGIGGFVAPSVGKGKFTRR